MTKYSLYVHLEAKPGKEQEVADFLIEVHQLQLAAVCFHQPIGAHQFTKACAVEVIYACHVHHYFLVAQVELLANQVTKQGTAFTERDSPDQIHYRDASDLSTCGLEAHCA